MNYHELLRRLSKGFLFETILLLLSVAFAMCVCQFHWFLLLHVRVDGEDASIKNAQQIIQPVAERYFKMEEPPVHFFYTKGDTVSDSLREFGDLPDDDNLLVILDIPSQMHYVSEVDVLTREAVEKFVNDFANGKLEGMKLKGWIRMTL